MGVGIAIGALLACWQVSVSPYAYKTFNLRSSLSEPLRIFFYNQSVFDDPAQGCWYDSGDYLIFAHRNAQSLYYLAQAYNYSQDEAQRADLRMTIESQEECMRSLWEQNIKQIGDVESHGINMPPMWHRIFYPRNIYEYEDGEGKDVAMLMELVFELIGDNARQAYWYGQAQERTYQTTSANCCEGGGLGLTDEAMGGIRYMTGDLTAAPPSVTWGASFVNIGLLEKGYTSRLQGLFSDVQMGWNKDSGEPFLYEAGNDDIAGTIALERMYAKRTGDESFAELSKGMWDYLHGENIYEVDFTNSDNLYHPCEFFGKCELEEVLIKGVDETGKFSTFGSNAWVMGESQLVGQAQYILAKVLMEE